MATGARRNDCQALRGRSGPVVHRDQGRKTSADSGDVRLHPRKPREWVKRSRVTSSRHPRPRSATARRPICIISHRFCALDRLRTKTYLELQGKRQRSRRRQGDRYQMSRAYRSFSTSCVSGHDLFELPKKNVAILARPPCERVALGQVHASRPLTKLTIATSTAAASFRRRRDVLGNAVRKRSRSGPKRSRPFVSNGNGAICFAVDSVRRDQRRHQARTGAQAKYNAGASDLPPLCPRRWRSFARSTRPTQTYVHQRW